MKRLIHFLLLFTTFHAAGQSRQVWLHKADEAFLKEDYNNALLFYQLVVNDTLIAPTEVLPYEVGLSNQALKGKHSDSLKKVPTADYILHQIAVCYLLTADYPHAVEQFGLTSAMPSYPEDLYHLGVARMQVNDYEKAMLSFENYVQSNDKNDSLEKMALQSMTGCRYAMDSTNVRTRMTVVKADSVFNRGTASFAPMFFEKENRILFTSAREGGVILDPLKQQSEYLCDLYWTQLENGAWTEPTNFGRPLNSAQHDASGSFNHNNVIFYTRWSDEKRSEQQIYLGRMLDYAFFEAYRLDASVNVPGYKSINPFVSLDGTTLFFSSNRPGGKGGMDLWRIAIDELGNPTGAAVNLGEPVNSEADEVSPFFHEAASTLYFSSNGHYSIGGLDIFKSTYNRDNETYAIPMNMGMPVNSGKDDAYMIWDRYMHKGYFSSDREECPTHHCYDIYEVSTTPIHLTLDGYVYDANTEKIIPNATLTFKDVRSVFQPFTITADSSGYYSLELQQFWEVFIRSQKQKYFADANSIDTRKLTEDAHLTQDFHLRPIPLEEVDISGIEYDSNSDKLRPKSKLILDKLVEFLQINDNLIIEINAHTDQIGRDSYNLDLSQRRAKSCTDYLVSRGISKDRLVPIGYGETQPAALVDAEGKPVLNAQGEAVTITEAYIATVLSKEDQAKLHQLNRRTAFKVIGESFVAP